MWQTICSGALLFGIQRIPPFANHRGKDTTSDWLADHGKSEALRGIVLFHKGRMKGDDPKIDTV